MNLRAISASDDRPQLQAKPPARAVGVFAPADFGRARSLVDGLSAFADHADWLDAREGLHMALFMSGVDLPIVNVDLCSFVRWCDFRGALRDMTSLDEFAALTADYRDGRLPRALAAVDEFDFANFNCRMEALADYRDFSTWTIHRNRVRANATIAGNVHELRVRLSEFVDWCACLALRQSEPALDRYAQLILEELVSGLAA